MARTVARKFSIRGLEGLWVCAEGLDTLKIDKISTDLSCFVFQFGGLGVLFWGDKPPKAPVVTGLGMAPWAPLVTSIFPPRTSGELLLWEELCT